MAAADSGLIGFIAPTDEKFIVVNADDHRFPPTGHQAETPAQPADLVTMMERPRNRRTALALASWTAERRSKGWYIRKTDHGGDWRGPYSTIASVSLMIARELAKELATRDGFAAHD